ncbi:hypothetical protein E4K72_13460 [Oxalobacteraceae bacterium OM1]|nr:hypothetical protein E4K72_13460 [Oxalobacteraceae bacterium OM1]
MSAKPKPNPAVCPCCNHPAAKHGSIGMYLCRKSKTSYTYTLCLACTKRNERLSHVARKLAIKRALKRLIADPWAYSCCAFYEDTNPFLFAVSPRLFELWARIATPEPTLIKPDFS